MGAEMRRHTWKTTDENYRGRIFGRLTALSLSMFLLTGCGNMLPEMTTQQEQAMGEYAAMILLRYDANSRSRLVPLPPETWESDEEKTEPVTAPEENTADEPQGMDPVADTPVVDAEGNVTQSGGAGSLESLFGLPEGVQLTFTGTQVAASYPEGEQREDFFALDAARDKSLLILHYTLSNQSGAEQAVDLLSRDATFKITVNGSYTRSALMTLLMDDMATFVGTLGAGDSRELVLVIEIDQSMAESVTSVSLEAKTDSQSFSAPLVY